MNSGQEKEIKELQTAYNDYIQQATSEGISLDDVIIDMADELFPDEGNYYNGGKKKRKKNKSKKKQKK